MSPGLIRAKWHICASLNWVIIGSDNGLSPVRPQAIIWTNADLDSQFNTKKHILMKFYLNFEYLHSTKWIWKCRLQKKMVILSQTQWVLTHWSRVTHICVSKLTIIGSDNGLSPGRRHAIIWTNTGILFIEPLGTNFSDIFIEIYTFSLKKMHLKMSSGKWLFRIRLNVLTPCVTSNTHIQSYTDVNKPICHKYQVYTFTSNCFIAACQSFIVSTIKF